MPHISDSALKKWNECPFLYKLEYIDGIECYYWNHTKEQTEFYINLAKKHNLMITGGTDHHSGERERIGKLEIDDSVMEELKNG